MTLVTNEPMPDNAEASFVYAKPAARVRNEFTAVIERGEDWFVAHCLGIPLAHGQGRTREEGLENLAEAILLRLEMRRKDGLRGVPAEAIREVIIVQ